MFRKIIDLYAATTNRLQGVGDWLAPLGLRLLLAWEFWESGIEKYRGENWFTDIQTNFPFPFNVVPTDISWGMATWFELIGGLALLFGLGTRFFAFSLFVLTIVATSAVHWPMDWQTLKDLVMGYAISNDGFGNFKLPFLFAAMLLPLIFRGAGKFSLDALIAVFIYRDDQENILDLRAWSLGLLVIAAPLSILFPIFGLSVSGLALVIGAISFFIRR
ncbi:MAG: HvfX family Cu-binding RiPP maturation protein [Methylococcales bacterium]